MKRWATVSLAWLVSTSIALCQAKLGLFVVDSMGQKVTDDAGGQNVLFMNGTAYAVPLDTRGFTPEGFQIFFPTADCSGLAYINYYGPITGFIQAITYTSDGLFHYAYTEPSVTIQLGSQRDLNYDGSLGVCLSSSGTVTVSPHITVPAPSFVPPFKLVENLQVSPAPPVPSFNDVPQTHPFYQYIEALKASGITGGCSVSPPLDCPDNPVTRGQLAVFIAKALGL